MRKSILIVAVAVLSGGCQPVRYFHPTKNSSDFEREKHLCYQEAVAYAANIGARGNPIIIRDAGHKCLEARFGWQRAKM